MTIQNLKAKLNQEKGKRQAIINSIEKKEIDYKQYKRDYLACEKAQVIIQTVAQQTQQKIKQYLEDMVTMAMETIFEEPYTFKVEFVIKRGKTEAELYFERDKELFNPIDSSGGGIIDIASFILRIALLSLKLGKKQNILILDEPLKWVSANYINSANELLSKLSKELGYQIIMVTHIKELVNNSDNIIEL